MEPSIKNESDDKFNITMDDDDLVKKLKNIPILPRIPKRQSNPSFKDENDTNLEHKSILEQRDILSFNNDQWKSSGWSSTFSGSSKTRNLRDNVKTNCTKAEKTVLRRNFSESNKRSCETKFDDMMTHKSDKGSENLLNQDLKDVTPKLIKNTAKSTNSKPLLTHQIIKTKNKVNHKSPKSKLSQDLQVSLMADFECFESQWTSELPRAPCKSLEDRVRERMLIKQSSSQQITDSKTGNFQNNEDQDSANLQEPNNPDESEHLTDFDSNKLFCETVSGDADEIYFECKNENVNNSDKNSFKSPIVLNDSINDSNNGINDPKIIDRISMPPPSMPPPTSKNLLRRKKTVNKNLIPASLQQLSGGNNENKPLWGKITKIQENVTSADLSNINGRKVTFNCPEVKKAQNLKKLGSDKIVKPLEKIEKNIYKSKNQAIVVGAMKQLLKPLYKRQKVNKQQYKDIMRDAVTKISRNDSLIKNKLLVLESGKKMITNFLKEEKIVKTK